MVINIIYTSQPPTQCHRSPYPRNTAMLSHYPPSLSASLPPPPASSLARPPSPPTHMHTIPHHTTPHHTTPHHTTPHHTTPLHLNPTQPNPIPPSHAAPQTSIAGDFEALNDLARLGGVVSHLSREVLVMPEDMAPLTVEPLMLALQPPPSDALSQMAAEVVPHALLAELLNTAMMLWALRVGNSVRMVCVGGGVRGRAAVCHLCVCVGGGRGLLCGEGRGGGICRDGRRSERGRGGERDSLM